MTKIRVRSPVPSVSSFRRRTYGYRRPASVGEVEECVPFEPVRHTRLYDTSYQLESPAHRAHYLSGAAVDDCYEIASKSRLRDQALLSAANTAVVTCETKQSPKSSVISSRLRAGQSPPRRSRRAQSEMVTKTYLSPEDNTTALIAGNAAAARFEYAPRATSPYSDVEVVVKRAVSPSPIRASVRYPLGLLTYRHQPYVSVRERRRAKTAKVAKPRSVSPEPVSRSRKAKSHFAQNKLRELDRKGQLSVEPPAVVTTSLRASRPPTVYRIDARTDPNDLLYKPASYNRMKGQVREMQDKMDRHRQLLDRYLQPGSYSSRDDSASKLAALKSQGASDAGAQSGSASSRYTSTNEAATTTTTTTATTSSSSSADAKPVSDLRKRLRRMVCKSRNDPSYYRD